MKAAEEILIKHWSKRMANVFGITDLTADDFEEQKKDYQFMIDAMIEFSNAQKLEILQFCSSHYPDGFKGDLKLLLNDFKEYSSE